MSETPKRTFRITEANYATLKALAYLNDMEVSVFVNYVLGRYAAEYGRDWQETPKPGNPNFVKKSETPTE